MPLHDFRCLSGHTTEEVVAQGVGWIFCPQCKEPANKVFLRFPAAFVQPDVHYASPVDGRPITSKQAHLEDLARNNCVAYDPEMKTDYLRRQKQADDRLEADIEHHFDAELSAMPARKKELLEQELRSGADLEFTRSTA